MSVMQVPYKQYYLKNQHSIFITLHQNEVMVSCHCQIVRNTYMEISFFINARDLKSVQV